MIILEAGTEVWHLEKRCTGEGNGGPGCRALLRVEEGDLFHTHRYLHDGSHEICTTFKCLQCGVLTDIQDVMPLRFHLPDKKAWEQDREYGERPLPKCNKCGEGFLGEEGEICIDCDRKNYETEDET